MAFDTWLILKNQKQKGGYRDLHSAQIRKSANHL